MDEATGGGVDLVYPYLRIAEALRGEIIEGRFQVGARLPSQADLEERFGVSRPTVQRALQELRKGGYIDNKRGRSAEILAWNVESADGVVSDESPEAAYESVASCIAEAFTRREVTIDIWSLTTETLGGALDAPIRRIRSGESRPESIKVRVLLPDWRAALALPKAVRDAADERPLRRLRQLALSHVVTLRSALTRLSEGQPDIALDIDFRTVNVTPLHKVYLINRHTALFGYYTVVDRPVRFSNGEETDIYDVLGVNALLFKHRADPDDPASPGSQFVAATQTWFDSLWSTIAEPFGLLE